MIRAQMLNVGEVCPDMKLGRGPCESDEQMVSIKEG